MPSRSPLLALVQPASSPPAASSAPRVARAPPRSPCAAFSCPARSFAALQLLSTAVDAASPCRGRGPTLPPTRPRLRAAPPSPVAAPVGPARCPAPATPPLVQPPLDPRAAAPWTQCSRPWTFEQPPLDPEQPPLAPAAAAPGAAAPGPRAAVPGPCSSRPWPLGQPPLDPRAATPGPRAAAPGPYSSRPWSSRPWTQSSHPWPLKQPPLVQPPLDPATPPLDPVQPPAESRPCSPGERLLFPPLTCGTLSHTQSRCFARLSDSWRTEFGDMAELPDWVELLRQRVDIFALDYDAILTAMYALPTSAASTCYLCATPDPGIEPAALGASEAAALGASASPALVAGEAATPGAGESALFGTALAEALYTFTLDSGASRSFFRDSITLTQLSRPVPVSLADPSGGPVLARSSTVLPCPAVPSGSLPGLHLPSFSTNLVSGADLQDQWVDQFTPGGQRVTHCTCSRTGRHLATFTRAPGSSLYTLTTVSPQTLLWHHRLGHPSVQRLRSMHRRVLVSGLPRVLPPLPTLPAPPCLPCVKGRQRAAPHSSSFPPTEAPLQTLHLDVWGPARVRGQGHEPYFLLVVVDYTRYTTVFPLRTKGEVPDVLIPWIRTARLQLRERFETDFPVLRLHSDRGGEFSSDLLAAFCAEHGIRQTLTLPASLQQNGVAERRIGLVMEVARTSMIHAAAPHFLWLFAVRYAAHQLNLWTRVSLPETSPTLLWTGKVGNASCFRVWGARAFVRDTTTDKLSARTAPCVFLGFVPDAPGWQFYHPTSRRVFPSQDATFNESVPFYRLFPYRTAPLPPPPLLG
ncbi:unnamed protein product [Closterium sp. NIES-53]